ncbi:MAG: hypothetical protein WCL44_07630 [bacterium]
MKARVILTAAVLVMGFVTAAQALDRDARVIGQLGVDVRSCKDLDTMRIIAWDETALGYERDWAVLSSVAVGKFRESEDDSNPLLWFAALGTKWYALPTTSLHLLGSYEWLGSGKGFRVAGGTVGIEQRITSRQAALSPFVKADASVQSVKIDPLETGSKEFTSLLLRGGVGCDMIMNDDVTLVFEVFFTNSMGSSDDADRDYADGWGGTVALKYFWF